MGDALVAVAHAGGDHGGGVSAAEAWRAVTAAALVAAAAAYGVGWARLRGRGPRLGAGAAVAYLGGLAAAAIALVSPLDARSDVTFSAHMVQHELLVLIAAPLVVAGRAELAVRAALPARARAALAAALHRPGAVAAARLASNRWLATALHAGVVALWHVPALFEAALASEHVHAVQHLSFFATAALFWWAMVRGRFGRAGYGLAVLFVFVTCVYKGVLGALFTAARHAVYPTHAERAAAAGVDPLHDQAYAGLLMWVPAGLVMTALGVAVFVAWLGAIERRARRPR